MRLTVWNMGVIIFWLGWGLVMAGSSAYEKGFLAMNNVLVRDWFMSQDGNSRLLKLWFIGLCLLMTLLGINLIFCSWQKIYKIIRVKFSGPKLYMLMRIVPVRLRIRKPLKDH
jgi:hypothetical protein